MINWAKDRHHDDGTGSSPASNTDGTDHETKNAGLGFAQPVLSGLAVRCIAGVFSLLLSPAPVCDSHHLPALQRLHSHLLGQLGVRRLQPLTLRRCQRMPAIDHGRAAMGCFRWLRHVVHGGRMRFRFLARFRHASEHSAGQATDARHSLDALHAAGAHAGRSRAEYLHVSARARRPGELLSDLRAALFELLHADLLQPLPGMVAADALLLVRRRSLKRFLISPL